MKPVSNSWESQLMVNFSKIILTTIKESCVACLLKCVFSMFYFQFVRDKENCTKKHIIELRCKIQDLDHNPNLIISFDEQ